MKRFKMTASIVMAAAGILFALSASNKLAAQSGTRSNAKSKAPFEERFWNYLTKEDYTKWTPLPGTDDGFAEGQSPHGAFIKTYLNRAAAGSTNALPSGSIIVKENYGPDKKTLMAVTVMYRYRGYNPEGGDWYWAKYNADGSIDKMPPNMGGMKVAGKVMMCIQCHGSADGGDLAFFND